MKRKHILMLDGAILLLIPICALASRWMLDALPDCIFRVNGILCPACGGTRCVWYFTHGQFAAAFHKNPYFFCTAVGALLLWGLAHIQSFTKWKWADKWMRKLFRPALLILWTIGLAVFGVLRNIL